MCLFAVLLIINPAFCCAACLLQRQAYIRKLEARLLHQHKQLAATAVSNRKGKRRSSSPGRPASSGPGGGGGGGVDMHASTSGAGGGGGSNRIHAIISSSGGGGGAGCTSSPGRSTSPGRLQQQDQQQLEQMLRFLPETNTSSSRYVEGPSHEQLRGQQQQGEEGGVDAGYMQQRRPGVGWGGGGGGGVGLWGGVELTGIQADQVKASFAKRRALGLAGGCTGGRRGAGGQHGSARKGVQVGGRSEGGVRVAWGAGPGGGRATRSTSNSAAGLAAVVMDERESGREAGRGQLAGVGGWGAGVGEEGVVDHGLMQQVVNMQSQLQQLEGQLEGLAVDLSGGPQQQQQQQHGVGPAGREMSFTQLPDHAGQGGCRQEGTASSNAWGGAAREGVWVDRELGVDPPKVLKRNSVPNSVLRAFASQGDESRQPEQQQQQQQQQAAVHEMRRVSRGADQQQLWELLADGQEDDDECNQQEEAAGVSAATAAAAGVAAAAAAATGTGGRGVAGVGKRDGQSKQKQNHHHQQQEQQLIRDPAASKSVNSRGSSGRGVSVVRAASQAVTHLASHQPPAVGAVAGTVAGRASAAAGAGKYPDSRPLQWQQQEEEEEELGEEQQKLAWGGQRIGPTGGRASLGRGSAAGVRGSPYKQRLGAATQKAVALLREQQARRQHKGGVKGLMVREGGDGGGYGDAAQVKAQQRLQQRVREQQERLRQQILAAAMQEEEQEEEEEGGYAEAAVAQQQKPQQEQRGVGEQQEVPQRREVSARDIWGGGVASREDEQQEQQQSSGSLFARDHHQEKQKEWDSGIVSGGCIEDEEEVYGQRSPADVPTPASQRFRTCAAAAVVGARESAYT